MSVSVFQNIGYRFGISVYRPKTNVYHVLCGVDFNKAFDSVHHEILWQATLDMGYLPHLADLLLKRYKKQKAKFRAYSRDTGTVGLNQAHFRNQNTERGDAAKV